MCHLHDEHCIPVAHVRLKIMMSDAQEYMQRRKRKTQREAMLINDIHGYRTDLLLV